MNEKKLILNKNIDVDELKYFVSANKEYEKLKKD